MKCSQFKKRTSKTKSMKTAGNFSYKKIGVETYFHIPENVNKSFHCFCLARHCLYACASKKG